MEVEIKRSSTQKKGYKKYKLLLDPEEKLIELLSSHENKYTWFKSGFPDFMVVDNDTNTLFFVEVKNNIEMAYSNLGLSKIQEEVINTLLEHNQKCFIWTPGDGFLDPDTHTATNQEILSRNTGDTFLPEKCNTQDIRIEKLIEEITRNRRRILTKLVKLELLIDELLSRVQPYYEELVGPYTEFARSESLRKRVKMYQQKIEEEYFRTHPEEKDF